MYRYQEASIQALSGFSIADVHKILLMGSNVPKAETGGMKVRGDLRPLSYARQAIKTPHSSGV